MQLTGQRPHPDDGLQLVAEVARIDLHRVALDHAALLQAAQAFGHAGRGQPADLRQGLERAARVCHQSIEQELVDFVGHGWLVR
ncbi:hypothetical protein D3C84_963190 [compost metagenome]